MAALQTHGRMRMRVRALPNKEGACACPPPPGGATLEEAPSLFGRRRADQQARSATHPRGVPHASPLMMIIGEGRGDGSITVGPLPPPPPAAASRARALYIEGTTRRPARRVRAWPLPTQPPPLPPSAADVAHLLSVMSAAACATAEHLSRSRATARPHDDYSCRVSSACQRKSRSRRASGNNQ